MSSQTPNRLQPAGAVCWTQSAYDDFIASNGCVPKGLLYQITDGDNAGYWIGSGFQNVPDVCLATKDLLNIVSGAVPPTNAPDGIPFYMQIDGADHDLWYWNGTAWVQVAVDGQDGDDGDDGQSAYQIAVANGFVGDVTAWLASLQGADGDDGLAAVATDGTLTGDGTAGSPLGLADFPNATTAEVAAIDGSTELLMKNAAGDLVCVSADDLGIGSGGGTTGPTTGVGPFTAGQNADDWVFNPTTFGGTGTLPVGPTAPDGYWVVSAGITDGTLAFAGGTTLTTDGEAVATSGDTWTFTASGPGGSLDSIRAHWVGF